MGFSHAEENEDEGTPEEQSLDCLQYRIERKVKLNSRVVAKDTEQDIVQLPSFSWPKIQEDADKILRKKIARDRRVRPDDATVVASVNDTNTVGDRRRRRLLHYRWISLEFSCGGAYCGRQALRRGLL